MEQFTKPIKGQYYVQKSGGGRRKPKFRVVLEAFEGSKTASRFSSEAGIHASLTRVWKRRLLKEGPRVIYSHERPHQSPDYRTPAEERFVLCSEPAAFA